MGSLTGSDLPGDTVAANYYRVQFYTETMTEGVKTFQWLPTTYCDKFYDPPIINGVDISGEIPAG